MQRNDELISIVFDPTHEGQVGTICKEVLKIVNTKIHSTIESAINFVYSHYTAPNKQ